MKGSRFACVAVPALVLAAMLMTAGSAVAQLPPIDVYVAHWGQSQIDEDGNLRFRVTAGASGISWTGYPDADYLQLWVHIVGVTNATDEWHLIKSRAAYTVNNGAVQPATSIVGTSTRFRLQRGTYTYNLFVVLNDSTSSVLAPPALAISAPAYPPPGRKVALP